MTELIEKRELAKVVRLLDQHNCFVLQYNIVIEKDGVPIAHNTYTELLEPDMDIEAIEDSEVKEAVKHHWTKEKVVEFKEFKKKK